MLPDPRRLSSLILILVSSTAFLFLIIPASHADTPASCHAYSCSLQSSAPFYTASFGEAGNGYFQPESSYPPDTMPVTSNVQAYNNNGNPQWLITCPATPNSMQQQEYITPTPNPLLGGDVCQASSSPFESQANLQASFSWVTGSPTSDGFTAQRGAISLGLSNVVQLNVQNLAYSGEAYNSSRGIGSANISNGYNSYSNIFSGVPPSNQKGMWTWNSKVADLSNLDVGLLALSNTIELNVYNQGCLFPYTYSLAVTLNKVSNIAIPVPVTSIPTGNYLSFNNQTFNGINLGTPSSLSTITPNAVAMSECYLPNFWGDWHLAGTNAILDYQSTTPTNGLCVYQYGSAPYYFTNYGTGDSASTVYTQYTSTTYNSAEQLPAFVYYTGIPSSYSAVSASFSYYTSSYYLYSHHNLQSPGNYLDPALIHSGPAIFLNDNGIFSELSYDSFFGGNYYAPSKSPPGLNLQAKDFPSVQCTGGACPTGVSSIPDPLFAAESSNNNLYVIGQTGSGYSLYDLRLVPYGQLNLSYNPPSSATYGYMGTEQSYNNMLQKYWNAAAYNQSFPGYIASVTPLPLSSSRPPLAMASDYAGDVFVLTANMVTSAFPAPANCPYGSPCGGTGFDILYVSASGGTMLTANVVSGPSSSIMQHFGKNIGSLRCIQSGVGGCSTYAPPFNGYIAASPSGQYVYVAEQNLSYVLIYSVVPASPVSSTAGAGTTGGPPTSKPPQISLTPSTITQGENVIINGVCANSLDTCRIDFPDKSTQLSVTYPQYTTCTTPGQQASCTFNTIPLSPDTYPIYAYVQTGPDKGAWASANLVVTSSLQYVLSASFTSYINLSYSTPQYNLSIDEYLQRDGGPFHSQGIAQWGANALHQPNNALDPYDCQAYLNDTPGILPGCGGYFMETGIWHMPMGLAISGSTLYVMDNWLFVPYTTWSGDKRASDAMLMLRAFYLNGTEVPIHPSNVPDVLPRNGGVLPSTGPIAKGEYPPYGWPISASFSLPGNTVYLYETYCAYLCSDTPQYNVSPVSGTNVIYGGYPPIGPYLSPDNKIPPSTIPGIAAVADPSEASGQPYVPPGPISISSDFNNTVYLDVWAQASVSASCTFTGESCSSTCGTAYLGGNNQNYQVCHLYTELLALHANIDNYTKTSNASASPPYGCYNLQAGGTQCGYLNNNYTAFNGIANVPNAYFCYMGANTAQDAAVEGGIGSATPVSGANSPCTMVDNLSLQAPPFIGMPDSFQYVESLGSPDSYITYPDIVNAYLSGAYLPSGLDPSGGPGTPPSLIISPGTAPLGENVILTTTCNTPAETCDIEYPQGTQWSTGNPYSDVSCNPSDGLGGMVSCTFNTIDLTQQGNYLFYSYTTGPPTSPDYQSWASENLIVSNSIQNELANVIANAQNAIPGQAPPQFLVPTSINTNVGGDLLIPYTYTYTVNQQWCAPGTSASGCATTVSATSADPSTGACETGGEPNTITLAGVAPPMTYNVYTTWPVPSSSALQEQIQGGFMVPQYANNFKYYIANLSDQYLIMPPQAFYNVFTSRLFGEIYVNQTVYPYVSPDKNGVRQGFTLLVSPYHDYYLLYPGAIVTNAIHVHDYLVVNTIQVYDNGQQQAPGYSVEDVLDQPPTPYTTHYNAENAINASWNVEYTTGNTVTLQAPVFAHDIVIDGGATLITDGHSLVATNSIVNNGAILGGYANDAGTLGGPGGSMPFSYGGSGGGSVAKTAVIDSMPVNVVGGNTLAPGGMQNQPGSTPAPPTITTALLGSWAYDTILYLTGAGGAAGSYQDNGGSGSFGVYLQADALMLGGGSISTMGQNGMQGSGGGGGGAIALVYGTAFSPPGSYSDAGGAGGPQGPDGPGQPGGSGQYVTNQISPSSNPVLLTRSNQQPPVGAACSICGVLPYYYVLNGPWVVATSLSATSSAGNHVFAGRSLFSADLYSGKSILQLFSNLKTYVWKEYTTIDLTWPPGTPGIDYNYQLLGYNRINYTFADEFNNIINMPIAADLANITTISLNAQTVINEINPNETRITITGTAGYYPSIYSVTPSPVPDGSDVYLYYDTNINFFNTSNSIFTGSNPDTNQYPNLNVAQPIAPTTPCYYVQSCADSWASTPVGGNSCYSAPASTACAAVSWNEYCAFGQNPTGVGNVPAGGCAVADPVLTTNLPIGQGPLAPFESNQITFNTQYNSIGECSPQPNSLLLPQGVNTMECNIYGLFDLPTSGNTVPINGQIYPEYCVPYNNNGNGVLTSQLGLIGIATTTSGKFSDTINVCGTGTARIQASYFGYPPGQPQVFLQTPLQSVSLAQPVKIKIFTYPTTECWPGVPGCLLASNTPLINTVEFSYRISPNSTAISFPIGTYYLSFGGIAGWAALILTIGLLSYVLLKGTLPAKS